MAENVADVDNLPSVLNCGNEPVLVAADVEYGEDADLVRVRKIAARIGEMPPGGAFGVGE